MRCSTRSIRSSSRRTLLSASFRSRNRTIYQPRKGPKTFIAALQQAKVSDIEYLTKLEVLESQGRDDEIAIGRLERELRDAIWCQLGLPQRPKKTEINRAEHARSLGIEPNPELQAKISKSSHSDQALQTLKFPDELESVVEKISQ